MARRGAGPGFIAWSLLPLLAASLLQAADASLLKLLRQPAVGPVLPVCTCACCESTQRRPDEIVGSVTLKCQAKLGPGGGEWTAESIKRVQGGYKGTETVDQSCQAQCSLPSNPDDSLGRSSDAGLEYDRFCFYSCQPHDFVVGHPCQPLDKDEAAKARDDSGNGKDPALQPATGSNSASDVDLIMPAFNPPGKRVQVPPPPVEEGPEVPCEERSPCIYEPMMEARRQAFQLMKDTMDEREKAR